MHRLASSIMAPFFRCQFSWQSHIVLHGYNPTGGMITGRLLIRTQMVKGPIYFLGMPGIQNLFFFHAKNIQMNHIYTIHNTHASLLLTNITHNIIIFFFFFFSFFFFVFIIIIIINYWKSSMFFNPETKKQDFNVHFNPTTTTFLPPPQDVRTDFRKVKFNRAGPLMLWEVRPLSLGTSRGWKVWKRLKRFHGGNFNHSHFVFFFADLAHKTQKKVLVTRMVVKKWGELVDEFGS